MSEKKYSTSDIIQILAYALILLDSRIITVSESSRYDESAPEEEKRVSLTKYIIRAVADELVEHFGETEEGVKKAMQETTLELSEFLYPNQEKCVGIYNDIQ